MAKMLYSAQQYVKKLNGFKSYIQKIKSSDDFTLVKERLLDALDTMCLYLDDMIISCESGSERKKCETHKTLVDSFRNTVKIANTNDDLVTVTSLLDLLNPSDMDHMNEFRLNNEADGLQFGYKECFTNIPEPYLNMLRDSITNQNINIFFPNCFDGTNAKHFGRNNDTTYGQEARYISEARSILNRVAKGE